MKKALAIFALLIVCGTKTIVVAQGSGTNIKPAFSAALLNTLFISSLPATKSQPSGSLIVNKSKDPDANNIESFTSVQFKYAMMLDVTVETLSNSALYNFIEDWFGTRYRLGGGTKRGIDCSAFTSTLLLAVYSISVPRTAREQYSACKAVPKEDLTEGDLVFFNTIGGVSHVGLYLANGFFVQSCSSEGVTISNLDDGYYSHRFLGGGRLSHD